MFVSLPITDLKYEELILLQEIMNDVYCHGIDTGRAIYDKEMFDSLYDKVMSSWDFHQMSVGHYKIR